MVSAAANTLEAYSLDTRAVSSLDRLASTTVFESQLEQTEEEVMDISKVSDGCYNCGTKGHMAHDCTKPRKPRDKEGVRKSFKCYFCDASGHTVDQCRKKKAYKEEQEKKRKVVKKTEEEEITEEEDYEEEEEEIEEEDGSVQFIEGADFRNPVGIE